MAASSPTFGPEWPHKNPNIVTLTRKDGLRLPIHKELVRLVQILMDRTEKMGYDIKPGETWGYANRAISGTNTPSNHSRGCAVDINAPSNPYASADWHRKNATSHPFGLAVRSDIPVKVFELWERNGFALGVKYKSKPDPMHFEFVQTVTEARAITKRLESEGTAPKPPAPKPPEEDDVPAAPIVKAKNKPEWWLIREDGREHLKTKDDGWARAMAGQARFEKASMDPAKCVPFTWDQKLIDAVPLAK